MGARGRREVGQGEVGWQRKTYSEARREAGPPGAAARVGAGGI